MVISPLRGNSYRVYINIYIYIFQKIYMNIYIYLHTPHTLVYDPPIHSPIYIVTNARICNSGTLDPSTGERNSHFWNTPTANPFNWQFSSDGLLQDFRGLPSENPCPRKSQWSCKWLLLGMGHPSHFFGTSTRMSCQYSCSIAEDLHLEQVLEKSAIYVGLRGMFLVYT